MAFLRSFSDKNPVHHDRRHHRRRPPDSPFHPRSTLLLPSNTLVQVDVHPNLIFPPFRNQHHHSTQTYDGNAVATATDRWQIDGRNLNDHDQSMMITRPDTTSPPCATTAQPNQWVKQSTPSANAPAHNTHDTQELLESIQCMCSPDIVTLVETSPDRYDTTTLLTSIQNMCSPAVIASLCDNIATAPTMMMTTATADLCPTIISSCSNPPACCIHLTTSETTTCPDEDPNPPTPPQHSRYLPLTTATPRWPHWRRWCQYIRLSLTMTTMECQCHHQTRQSTPTPTPTYIDPAKPWHIHHAGATRSTGFFRPLTAWRLRLLTCPRQLPTCLRPLPPWTATQPPLNLPPRWNDSPCLHWTHTNPHPSHSHSDPPLANAAAPSFLYLPPIPHLPVTAN